MEICNVNKYNISTVLRSAETYVADIIMHCHEFWSYGPCFWKFHWINCINKSKSECFPQGKKSGICGGSASEHNTRRHTQWIQMPAMAPLGRTPPARFKASVCLTHLVAIYHTAPFGAITLCVLPDLFPLTFICNGISLSLSHSL